VTSSVTVKILGTNDAASISGTSTGSVLEAGGIANATPGSPTATGTLTIPTSTSGQYLHGGDDGNRKHRRLRTWTMTSAGVWTYHLDTQFHGAALNAGATLLDSFHSDHQRRHAPNRDHHNYRQQ